MLDGRGLAAAWNQRGGREPAPPGRSELESDPDRGRAVQMYRYLREYVRLRMRPTLRVEDYQTNGEGAVIWLNDLPRVPGCHCAALNPDARDDELWLSVRRPARRDPPPPLPTSLQPWVDADSLGDSSQDEPKLQEEIRNPAGDWLALDEHPEVRDAHRRYVTERWTPWAERDRSLARQQDFYNELFRIEQQYRRLGETFELVVGLGLLTWQPPHGMSVRRHLVVAQADVQFDASRGEVRVTAAADGARLALEDDMLNPEDRPDRAALGGVTSALSEVGDDIFGDASVSEVLRSWAHTASSRGSFDEELAPQRDTRAEPHVRLAPALILRKRSGRSIEQALTTIIEQLQAGGPIPDGVRRLVASELAPQEGNVGGEVFFPLPANPEQLEIVDRLRTRPGVLVQGPPGTGKSHTVANLVSHLLAEGKRVLVTSHTPRALEVLRQKIPEPIRELAVVVLGNDTSGRKELTASVHGISNRKASWSERHSQVEIAGERHRLAEARKQEQHAMEQLRELRRADSVVSTPPHAVGYSGTPLSIAKQVEAAADRYGWTRWLIDAGPCPVSVEEAGELQGLLSSVDEGVRHETSFVFPDPRSLPGPEWFESLLSELRQGESSVAELAAVRVHPSYGALVEATPELRGALHGALYALWHARQGLRSRTEPWVATAAEQVLGSHTARWADLCRASRAEIEHARASLARSGATNVTGLDDLDPGTVRVDARALHDHLRLGRGFGTGPFRSAVVKRTGYLVEKVRVDGAPCRDPATLSRLLWWLEARDALRRLDALWGAVATVGPGPLPGRLAEYGDLVRALEEVLRLDPLQQRVGAVVSQSPRLVASGWRDPRWILPTLQALELIERERALAVHKAKLDKLSRALRSPVEETRFHRLGTVLLNAVQRRDLSGYRSAFVELQQLAEARGRVQRCDELLRRIRGAAPRLDKSLDDPHSAKVFGSQVATLPDAWSWRQADIWLERSADARTQAALWGRLDEAHQEVESATVRLVTALAWASCLHRMTEDQRKSLMAWEQAVRKIGKGTGKTAPHWRRQAQIAMEGCRPAIPAWIMPIYKVAETIGVMPEAFDVVIVDEASQSGPEALFLHYLARQVVVIGDDQQISPENAGVERAQVEALIRDHLTGVRLAEHFGADSSLFDLTRIHFPDQLVLREHFRCVPEIIEFSNRLCYRDRPLIPLKQFGAGRLSPAIRPVSVPGGVVSGDVNEPEARALVEQVRKCIHDPAYEGKTMGVISLVGDRQGQARYIQRLLEREVGPDEMTRRRLVCGNAYAFQGDERDVMFLSLFQARQEGRRIGALTTDAAMRRFNVAASRAREQMWLFHSVTPNDLNPESAACKLLTYCLHPTVEPAPLEALRIEQLRRSAADPDRDRIPRPFESWLEVEVYLHLFDRGFRVLPKYRIADLEVDLLVEGSRSRLAVCCEDDEWPGDSGFDHELQRRRALERAGMPFHSVRGAAFYRDREATLEALLGALADAGITAPGEEPEAEPSSVGETPEAPANDVSDDEDDTRVELSTTTQEPSAGQEPTVADGDAPLSLGARPDLLARLHMAGAKPSGPKVQPLGDGGPAVGPALGQEHPPAEVIPGRPSAEPPSPDRSQTVGPRTRRWTVPYRVAELDSWHPRHDFYDPDAGEEIRAAMTVIIRAEAPIHRDVLLRRLREAWGYKRSGREIQDIFARQLGLMRRSASVGLRGPFVWLPGQNLNAIRVPTDDPRSERQIADVPPEELSMASQAVVQRASRYGVTVEGAIIATAEIFGWRRRGSEIRAALKATIDQLIADGLVRLRGDALLWCGPAPDSTDT